MLTKPTFSRRNRPKPSYGKILIAILSGGIKALASIEPKPSKHSLMRALIELKKQGNEKVHAELSEHMKQSFPPSVRGKYPPAIGDVRDYLVQLGVGNALFIRTPVSILDVPRGKPLKAGFGKLPPESVLKSGKFIVLWSR